MVDTLKHTPLTPGLSLGVRARAGEVVLGRQMRAFVIENDLLAVMVLLDVGCDIISLYYKPRDLELLWRSPIASREPGVGPDVGGDSGQTWTAYFRGGWPIVFPNFGDPVTYKGAPLDFHGEAARLPWRLESIAQNGRVATVEASAELIKSPFTLRRRMTLRHGSPVLELTESITNTGCEPMDCMLAEHPAWGPPLIGPECVIDTGARSFVAADDYDVASNDFTPGAAGEWPNGRNRAGEPVDLSQVPGPGAGFSRAIYLKDFGGTPWFAFTNPALGLGVGMSWDGAVLPYALMWEESGGERQYPWYGKAYLAAIEPFSSLTRSGLHAAIKQGTQLVIPPGKTRTLDLRVAIYEGNQRVARIDADGNVERR